MATINSNTTINSLIINVASATNTSLDGTGTLTITSGAVLLNPGNTSQTLSINANLNFGTAQGVIGASYNRSTQINGGIAGSGGLVLYNVSQNGPTVSTSGFTLNGIGTYTGNTYFVGGIQLQSTNFLPYPLERAMFTCTARCGCPLSVATWLSTAWTALEVCLTATAAAVHSPSATTTRQAPLVASSAQLTSWGSSRRNWHGGPNGANTWNDSGGASFTINGGAVDIGGGTASGSVSALNVLALGGGALNYTVTGTNIRSAASMDHECLWLLLGQ